MTDQDLAFTVETVPFDLDSALAALGITPAEYAAAQAAHDALPPAIRYVVDALNTDFEQRMLGLPTDLTST